MSQAPTDALDPKRKHPDLIVGFQRGGRIRSSAAFEQQLEPLRACTIAMVGGYYYLGEVPRHGLNAGVIPR